MSAAALLATAVPLFRPGTTLPAATAGLPAAPGLRTRGGRPVQTSVLRRTLRFAFAEGIVAEVLGAFAGGAVLTGWALYLGCSALEAAVIVSLPQFAQLVQVPAAFATRFFGSRRLCVWAVGLSRQIYLPLAALPYLPLPTDSKRTLLLILAALQAALAVLGNNAWVAWMGDLVPRRLVGRYFGLRTAYATGVGALAAGLAGAWLDQARNGQSGGHALSALALCACVLGVVTTYLLFQQHDPVPDAKRARGPISWRRAFAPYRDPMVRPLLIYQVWWNAAVGLAASYFAFHMIKNLKLGFFFVAAHGTAVAMARMFSAPWMGRTIDKMGARPMLVMCSFAISVLPALWLGVTPTRLWPLALDVLLSGVFWGGHALAMLALPMRVATGPERPFSIAAIGTVGGMAFAASTYAAGLLVQAIPDRFTLVGTEFVDIHVLLVASFVARVAASFSALRIRDPRARSLRDLLSQTFARGHLPNVMQSSLKPAPQTPRK